MFELINQLTKELRPREIGGVEDDSPVSVKIKRPFSVLLNVDEELRRL